MHFFWGDTSWYDNERAEFSGKGGRKNVFKSIPWQSQPVGWLCYSKKNWIINAS